MPEPPAVTRLAPSPTGALHLGNARTFLVTWALARRNGWRVLMRIEDLDGPRVKPGAGEAALDVMRWLGMDWDGPAVVQSHDLSAYEEAMERLARAGLAYPCELTRAEIEASASAPQSGGPAEARFPAELRPAVTARAFDVAGQNWRFVTPDREVTFDDDFAGPQRLNPSRTVGDFVVWTKRSQPSYQLAVVVDDARQGVTHVVRGDDLLDSAARQLLLYGALSLRAPSRWCHLPLVVGTDGRRLAKRHGDTRIEAYRERGVPPERVIGLIAYWCGTIGVPRPMSVGEFVGSLRLDTMPRSAVVFTPGHDQWLMQHAPTR